MEKFEIHITGDESILESQYKTIAIDLLRPDKSVLRTEYMTSMVLAAENYDQCFLQVNDIAAGLAKHNIVRIKIESPVYDHYIGQSRYIESHFETDESGFQQQFAISRNQNKPTLLATDRVYPNTKWLASVVEFKKLWEKSVVELCLFDSNVMEDADWFFIWRHNK